MGGLRRTVTALKKLPEAVAAGAATSAALDELFDTNPDIETTFLEATSEKVDESPKVEAAGQLVADCIGSVVGCKDTSRGCSHGLDCELRDELIGAWRCYAQDPDDQVEGWLKQGSPMGIALKPQPRGVFPEYEDARAAIDPSVLESEAADLGYSPRARMR